MIQSFNTLWHGLTNQQQTSVIWILVFSTFTFITYTFYHIIMAIIEYNRPIYTLKISTDDNRREGVDSSEEFTNLFSMLHTPHQSDILTIEIHKLPDFQRIILTTRNKNKARFLQGILMNMEGVTVECQDTTKNDSVPLNYFSINKNTKSTVFKSTMIYGNFKSSSTKFIQTLQKALKDLQIDEYTSVLISMRPVNIKQKLAIKIGELRYKVYDNQNKVPNQHKQYQIEKLSKKNEYQMYSVKPQIIASNKEVLQKVEGLFNLISNENTLYPTNSSKNIKKARFVANQTIFSTPLYYLGLSTSSYLNTKELGSFLYF
jgi:hypothetical protein